MQGLDLHSTTTRTRTALLHFANQYCTQQELHIKKRQDGIACFIDQPHFGADGKRLRCWSVSQRMQETGFYIIPQHFKLCVVQTPFPLTVNGTPL